MDINNSDLCIELSSQSSFEALDNVEFKVSA